MKLVIDRGNTRYKLAVFEKDDMVYFSSFPTLSISILENLFDKFDLRQTIISSVAGKEEKTVMNYLTDNTELFSMSDDLSLPIRIDYSTPSTLGKDRIAAAVAASVLYSGDAVLVIDAGSCVCFDFIDENKVYRGGSITTGIEMKYKALHTFTTDLPLIEGKHESVGLCENSTLGCIKSGVLNGTVAEIESMINRYLKEKNNIKIVLTGGDAGFIAERLDCDAIVEEQLVLKGLNIILDVNAKKRV